MIADLLYRKKDDIKEILDAKINKRSLGPPPLLQATKKKTQELLHGKQGYSESTPVQYDILNI